DGIVCSGARRGKQATYVLLEERVPPAPPRDRDDALCELTGRYFATRGPATLKDFAWWSGLTLADARKGVQMAGRGLIGGETYWHDPAVRSRRKRSPTAHLLPNYDEYFIGFKNRSAIGKRLNSTDIVMGRDALTPHVIVVDGQLGGGGKRTLTKTAVGVELRVRADLRAS